MTTSVFTTTKSSDGKITWPQAPAVKQYFSVPSSILYYILKRSLADPITGDKYYRLIQLCKYFFEKCPVLIVTCFFNNGKKFCSRRYVVKRHQNKRCCVNLDMNKLRCNIWLFGEFKLANYPFLLVSSSLISSMLCRREFAHLSIINTIIPFKDFQVLAEKFRIFSINDVKMIDNDGDAVMLEKIIESCPNLRDFNYWFGRKRPAVTASTLKNILKLKNLDKLLDFQMVDIPEVFAVEDFAEFIKSQVNTKIWFDFHWNISEEYKIQLDELVDAVVASARRKCLISYVGLDKEKYIIMKSRDDENPFSCYEK